MSIAKVLYKYLLLSTDKNPDGSRFNGNVPFPENVSITEALASGKFLGASMVRPFITSTRGVRTSQVDNDEWKSAVLRLQKALGINTKMTIMVWDKKESVYHKTDDCPLEESDKVFIQSPTIVKYGHILPE